MYSKVIFTVLICIYFDCVVCRTTAISESLIKCYETNYTSTFPKPPLTMKILIEIIRKLELDERNALNMRMLTTSMLHKVRLDGIQRSPSNLEMEHVIPYRAIGNQFNKYKLLVNYLIAGESTLFPEDSITTSELCLLHKMISNTVHPWERGDEKKTCPLTRSMPYNTNYKSYEYAYATQLSKCPLEEGVVKTKWGTVSPGHIVAGVAAALEKSTIQFQELAEEINKDQDEEDRKTYKTLSDINNVWTSTIVGDIAEIVIYQNSENPVVGSIGFWNDSIYPRAHYLTGREWDLTDAELLGGIDGAIIASELKKWLNIVDLTRFSQVLDMYYSNRGIAYNPSYKACNRYAKYNEINENIDIEEQTSNVAKLLQIIGNPTESTNEEGINVLSKIAVTQYKRKAETKMSSIVCEQSESNILPMELILIFGGEWNPYEINQFISGLIEKIDVYDTKIGIINGQNGKWLTNITNSIVQLYTDLANENNTWPTTLSLSQSFEAVISYYQTKTEPDCDYLKPIGQVIMVLTNSALINDVDYKRTFPALKSIKNSNPESNIIYVTNELNYLTYETFASKYDNDIILNTPNDDVDKTIDLISKKLNNKPCNIVNFYCDNSQAHFENYVTPNVTAFYEIQNAYIQKADISVKFKGNGYADLLICAYDTNAIEMKVCKAVTENDVSFKVRDHCSSISACNLHFSVQTNNSKFKCAELDCRYPDQARLDIYSSWIYGSGSTNFNIVNIFILMLFMHISLLTNNYSY